MPEKEIETGHDRAEPGISCDACPQNAVQSTSSVRAVDAREKVNMNRKGWAILGLGIVIINDSKPCYR